MEVRTQRVPCNVYVTPFGATYFARDPLRSYFHEPQKNEIYVLNETEKKNQQSILKIISDLFIWVCRLGYFQNLYPYIFFHPCIDPCFRPPISSYRIDARHQP